jgi:uracil-DNA glycosylase
MMNKSPIKLDASWLKQIKAEFDQPYMTALKSFLQVEYDTGQIVYPPMEDMFNAFAQTPFDRVKVVILGQDPYHGEGQAHGLAFSVKNGVRLPPSLRNIYKEIEAEFGGPMPKGGDLTGWARQGVLLLNATLTVRAGLAGSHQKKGWEEFTDAVIRAVNDHREHIVFMLWGAYAQKKGAFIDHQRHLVLKSAHPSPLSAHNGFFKNGHFKKANEYLVNHGQQAIDWKAP